MLNRLLHAKPAVPAIDVATLAVVRASGADVQIVNGRGPNEWNAGHLPGAVLIPLGELANRARELDPARPTVVVCRSGNRSGVAVTFLGQRGFRDVKNFIGGTVAWAKAEQPLVR